ncbi:MAG: DUF2851 family protein, partial [Betaproteobacteria bacterium]|nr:DUF2851 family protein [Betaproteobacteria bacterium]
PSQPEKKVMGIQQVDTLAINVLLPIMYAYACKRGEEWLIKKVLSFYEELPAEKNRITSLWAKTDVKNISAADSQALMELTHHFCQTKNCLQCTVGKKIFESDAAIPS